jgi:NhaP-type Na+/H+ or K+/H+ antiporter
LAALKKVGRAAAKMAFMPALTEAGVLALLLHFIAGFEWKAAALAAALLSAVSPAVVVPAMVTLNEEGYGRERDVPTMLLAGASLDNVLVIILFSSLLGLAGGGDVNLLRTFLLIPWSILLGILPGLALGFFLVWFFQRYYHRIRATEKTLLVLGLSVLLVQVGEWTQAASLLGIMTLGFVLLARAEKVAAELAGKLGKLWVFSEIILFVLIGMSVRLVVALRAGPMALLIIVIGLIARSAGVLFATAGSALTRKEKLFSVIAYLPKASVQAALGAVPLQHGIAGGEVILAYAVVAILFTTPLGLVGIRAGGPRLLRISRSSR